MRLPCLLTLAFFCQVSATVFTYRVKANENACFFAHTSEENKKLAFYFSVCLHVDLQVMMTDSIERYKLGEILTSTMLREIPRVKSLSVVKRKDRGTTSLPE